MRLIPFIGVLVVLFLTFPIGRAVSRRVPDEVPPNRTYVQLVPDALLLVLLATVLIGFGQVLLAYLVPLVVAATRIFDVQHVYPGLAGIALAFGSLLPAETFVMLGIVCLALNYALGLLETRWTVAQPALALLLIAL